MSCFAWEKPFFKNREEAARLLAVRLSDYQGENPLVMAIPRGAVPMGRIIANALGGELDLVLVHKVGAPDNPEFAVGAVSEGGEYYEAPYARSVGYPEEVMREGIQREAALLVERRKRYGLEASRSSTRGRVVILVDDGIATASTVMAAIREVRRQGPLKVVVAAPVAPPEALEILRREADEVAILTVQSDFKAVGEFFEDFSQVTDEQVLQALKDQSSKFNVKNMT